ncbi:hypothetical protein M885DRAFT_539654 [Pelagophyceae sp. CCMP2097]|nr:hypothetical protein M885DRAFT_539654 [Pelagophyceae sp. CCMP2097]
MATKRFAASLRAAANEATIRVATPSGGRRASIAAVFRVDAATGAEQVLFIKRARSETDPWSGNIALPGGRQEPSDGDDDERTAARETLEEVGIDVFDETKFDRLGRIADDRTVAVSGRGHLVVSMFGFDEKQGASSGAPKIVIDQSEVLVAWWVPTHVIAGDHAQWRDIPIERCVGASVLKDRPRLLRVARALGLGDVRFACVRLPEPPTLQAACEDSFALWGLTLAFFSDALRRSNFATPVVGAGAPAGFERGYRANGGFLPDVLLRTLFEVSQWSPQRTILASCTAVAATAAAVSLVRR